MVCRQLVMLALVTALVGGWGICARKTLRH